MKKQVKIAAIVACGLIAALSALYAVLRPLTVETVILEPQTVSLTFTETGSYEYSRVYAVYPLVAGEILEVPVKEGHRVRAGDVIAVVSASDYQHQIVQLSSAIAGYQGQLANLQLQEQQEKAGLSGTLENLRGQLASLEAEMEKNRSATASLGTQVSIQEDIVRINYSSVTHARNHLRDMRDYGDDAEISQARQALNAAQSTLAQNQLLLEQLREGDIPEAVYEGQRQAIQAQIDAAGVQLSRGYTGGMQQYYNAQIEAARASIAQMEEKAGQATVTAPVDGVLCLLPAGDQNLLSQQTPAAYIGDAPCVEVFVPIREIGGIDVGDTVELILDKRLGNETIAGTVFDIEEEAQVKLSALGVEERKVRVLIRPAGDSLQIGYDMDVRFSPYTFADVLVIPKTAVFQIGEDDCVWLANSGRLELCPVDKEAETREGYIVSSLGEGALVVADANDGSLAEGRRVAVSP